MPNRVALAALTLLTLSLLLTGCGDKPDEKLAKAKYALKENQPDLAKQLAFEVIDSTDDLELQAEGRQVLSYAQMQLGNLLAAKTTIDELIRDQPDSVKGREAQQLWVLLRLKTLRTQTDFATNEKLQTEFVEAVAIGDEVANWHERTSEDRAVAEFVRGRVDEEQAHREGAMLRGYYASIESADKSALDLTVDDTGEEPKAPQEQADDPEVAAYRSRIDGYIADARDHFRNVIDIDPDHIEATKKYVEFAARDKQWAQIKEIAEKLAKRDTIKAGVAERVVMMMFQMPAKDYPLAERMVLAKKLQDKVDEKGQRSKDWRLSQTRILLAEKKPQEARRVIKELLTKRSNDIEGQYLLAQTFYEEKKYDKAKQVLDKLGANKKAGGSIQILLLRAVTLEQLGEDSLAKEAYRSVLRLDRRNPSALKGMARITVTTNPGPDSIQKQIDDLYESNPIDPRNILTKMRYEQSQNDKDEVRKLLKDVERIRAPTEAHIEILVAGYNYLEAYDKAESFARQLIQKRRLHKSGYLMLAEVQLRQDDEDSALQTIADIQERFPDAGSRDLLLGQLYLRTQRFDDALVMLNKELEAKPDDLNTRMLVARTYAAMARTQSALEHLDRVIDLAPNHIGAHSLAARIYQFTGQQDQVRKHLLSVPEDAISEAAHPALYMQRKIIGDDVKEAAKAGQRAIASGNTDPLLRMMLANVYLKLNQPDQAEEHLKALVERQSNNAQAYQLLARFFLQQNSERDGIAYFKEIQRNNETLSRLAQAMLHSGLKEYDDAREALDRIYEPLVADKDNLALGVADALAKIYLAEAANYEAEDNTQLADRMRQMAKDVYQPLVEANHYTHEAKFRRIDIDKSKDQPEVRLKKLRDLAATLKPEDEALRRQAMLAMVAMDKHDDAMALLDQWIDERPNDITARRWKGELLIEKGRAADAVPVFEDAVRAKPKSKQMRQRLALAYIASFQYPAAEDVYLEMRTLDPSAQIEALSELGRMYVTIGLNKQAAAMFNELEKLGRSHDPRIIFAMAQARAAMGEDERAMTSYRLVPPFASQYARARVRLAQLEIAAGRTPLARKDIKRLSANPRTAARLVPELLKLDVRRDFNEDLLRAANEVIADNVGVLEPVDRVPWLWRRVTLLAEELDWPGVLKTLEVIQQYDPQSDKALVLRMLVMGRDKSKLPEARALLLANSRISKTPIGPAIHVVLDADIETTGSYGGFSGYLMALSRGDVAAAESAIDTIPPQRTIYRSDLRAVLERGDAASKNMQRAAKMQLAGVVALELGLPQLALEHADDAIAAVPTMAPAYGLKVQALIDKADHTERDRVWNALGRKAPASALYLYLSMIKDNTDGNYIAAAAKCRQLLEQEPNNYYIQYSLSQQLQLAKKYQDAIEVLRNVSRRGGPLKLLAVNDLAYTVAEHKPDEMETAHAMALKAFEIAPTNMPLLDTIGWIEYLQGNHDKALEHLSKAIVGLKDLPEVHYHLALVYQKRGNKRWSMYHMQQAAASTADKREVQLAREALGNAR